MLDLRRAVKSIVVDVRKMAGMFRRLDREAIATHYLRGNGLEVGGLHNPLMVPPGARVRYVDRLPVEELRKQYPELSGRNLVPVDVLDDGEKLSTVQPSSQDFVVANHFLEHCENPIETLGNLLRVLKRDGILYMAVPDKRYTFDIDRPVTAFEHIVRDYREGPAWSREGHFREWVRLVEHVQDEEKAAVRMKELLAMSYSIHYHVWTQGELLDLVASLRKDFQFPWEQELVMKGEGEVILVLRKTT
jgi:predicted SAM-dependent methyltransferase